MVVPNWGKTGKGWVSLLLLLLCSLKDVTCSGEVFYRCSAGPHPQMHGWPKMFRTKQYLVILLQEVTVLHQEKAEAVKAEKAFIFSTKQLPKGCPCSC